MIRKAADWIIENTTSRTREQIQESYTFYSHVGNALALWRQTSPPDFWMQWETQHPFQPKDGRQPVVRKPTPEAEPEESPTEITVSDEAAADEVRKPAGPSDAEGPATDGR